jgi:hypothetical protein
MVQQYLTALEDIFKPMLSASSKDISEWLMAFDQLQLDITHSPDSLIQEKSASLVHRLLTDFVNSLFQKLHQNFLGRIMAVETAASAGGLSELSNAVIDLKKSLLGDILQTLKVINLGNASFEPSFRQQLNKFDLLTPLDQFWKRMVNQIKVTFRHLYC